VYLADDVAAKFGYKPGERLLIQNFGFPGTYFSYGYNTGGADTGHGPNGIGSAYYVLDTESDVWENELRRPDSIRSGSEFILMTDTNADGFFDFETGPYISARLDLTPDSYMISFELIGRPHRGGLNVLFYDGHVQWYSYSDLTMNRYVPVIPNDGPKQRMWNWDNKPNR